MSNEFEQISVKRGFMKHNGGVLFRNISETEYEFKSTINENNKIIVDNLKWNGQAKKIGFEIGDYISELKIENSNRPSKVAVYPITILFLLIFGYLNYRRKE